MKRAIGLTVTGILLAGLLAACTITTTFDPGLSGRVRFETPVYAANVLSDFRPGRGSGAVYRIGEDISFVLRSSRYGYVTLSFLDSSGRSAVFARNIPVSPTRNVISGPDSRHVFTVAEPTGIMQIRATFTERRTNEASVSIIGRGGNSGWNSRLVLDISGQPVYDAVQTWVEVR